MRKIGNLLRDFALETGVDFFQYGGEEFLGIACNCDSGQLKAFAQDIHNRIQKLNIPFEVTKNEIVTVSIGYSSGAGIEGESLFLWRIKPYITLNPTVEITMLSLYSNMKIVA